MAPRNFEKCLELVLEHEGGFVNHPKDPGGATNMGITKATYESWVGHPVTVQDIENLKVSDIEPIYKERYWKAMSCQAIPKGIDLMVFDFGVNSGVSRSARYLQQVVGTKTDGAIGPITLKAIDDMIDQDGAYDIIRAIRDKRVTFLRQIRTFDTFGRGWMRRVEKTTAFATAML